MNDEGSSLAFIVHWVLRNSETLLRNSETLSDSAWVISDLTS
jgi:hypothetical protein